MKVKVALLCLVGALVFSATAEAYYFVPFGKARRYSKIFVREECESHGQSCLHWKVGHCGRVTEQRVDCAAVIGLRSFYCQFFVENRVAPYGNGRVHQRRLHRRCYYYE